MSFDCPHCSASCTPSPLLPTLTSLGEVASAGSGSDGEVKQDQLAFTIESPSHPQLQLFETVFNTVKSMPRASIPPSGIPKICSYCNLFLLFFLATHILSF
ncbi:hypothetical protein GG344DRAFT_84795 [Lentinula edodes]|nr:hypothetical protein GG344DRAFT_84795 [Lentinula edodes]